MRHWRMVVVMLSALLVPTVAFAAAAGKVVIAQGVDPTTLDMMNQSEQPASNVGAQMFESLLERDPSLIQCFGLERDPFRPAFTVAGIHPHLRVVTPTPPPQTSDSLLAAIEDRFKTKLATRGHFGIKLLVRMRGA